MKEEIYYLPTREEIAEVLRLDNHPNYVYYIDSEGNGHFIPLKFLDELEAVYLGEL